MQCTHLSSRSSPKPSPSPKGITEQLPKARRPTSKTAAIIVQYKLDQEKTHLLLGRSGSKAPDYFTEIQAHERTCVQTCACILFSFIYLIASSGIFHTSMPIVYQLLLLSYTADHKHFAICIIINTKLKKQSLSTTSHNGRTLANRVPHLKNVCNQIGGKGTCTLNCNVIVW